MKLLRQQPRSPRSRVPHVKTGPRRARLTSKSPLTPAGRPEPYPLPAGEPNRSQLRSPTQQRKEGDLIIGLDKSAFGTLVERTTRYTMLLHLPRMEGHGVEPRVKNGPPLAGHGAEAVRDAIAAKISTLPEQLRATLTWDQGSEMAQHARLRSTPDWMCSSAIRTRPGSAGATKTPTDCCASTSRLVWSQRCRDRGCCP